jgi:putative hemolysin
MTSGAEVALFSLQHKDVNMLKTKQHAAARRITNLLEERKPFTLPVNRRRGFQYQRHHPFQFSYLHPYCMWADQHRGSHQHRHADQDRDHCFRDRIFWKDAAQSMGNTEHPPVRIQCVFCGGSPASSVARISQRMVSFADQVSETSGANESEATSMKELDDAIDINNDQTSIEEKNILKGIVKFSNISVKQIMRFRLDVNGSNTEHHA